MIPSRGMLVPVVVLDSEIIDRLAPLTVRVATEFGVPPGLLPEIGLRMYVTYVPNKTISVPDDVVPIIDGLEVPFSTWVTNQLRHHAAAHTGLTLGQQLLADAALAGAEPPSDEESRAVVERMERSAPW